MRKRGLAFIICAAMVISLCACAEAPQSSIVTSKNDGSFDASVIKPAEREREEALSVDRTDSFSGSDGTVAFTFNVHEQIKVPPMPIVEVIPHSFSPEDAENIAKALFGDAQVYEAEPVETLSKSEIRDNLALWSKYLNRETLFALYGGNSTDNTEALYEDMSRIIQGFIDKYTAMLETAPDTVEHTPCQWTFYPDTHYSAQGESSQTKEKSNLSIMAWVKEANIPYTFSISNRDEPDYKIHNVFAYVKEESSPNGINKSIILSELCKAGVPTEEQMDAAKLKASKMLSEMKIGDWYVDDAYYAPLGFGGADKYTIYVTAVPVFNGNPVVRQLQLGNLKSKENYASNYYYTDATFCFSTDSKLLRCTIMSPVDVKTVLNENVQTLSIEELIEKAKAHLSLYDYSEYAWFMMADDDDTSFNCTVEITGMDYGLTRVKVPNTKDSYYYVPALSLRGNYQVYETNSGALWYDTNSAYANEPQTLLVLNAVDGSIINVSNGY